MFQQIFQFFIYFMSKKRVFYLFHAHKWYFSMILDQTHKKKFLIFHDLRPSWKFSLHIIKKFEIFSSILYVFMTFPGHFLSHKPLIFHWLFMTSDPSHLSPSWNFVPWAHKKFWFFFIDFMRFQDIFLHTNFLFFMTSHPVHDPETSIFQPRNFFSLMTL
jgi:hypothetical protein